MRVQLSADSTIDIAEPKLQEKRYEPRNPTRFSWSIYARETGDHIIDARIYLETAKGSFREMKISPVRMEMTVTKFDHVQRWMWMLGTAIVGIAGFVLVVKQIVARKEGESAGGDEPEPQKPWDTP